MTKEIQKNIGYLFYKKLYDSKNIHDKLLKNCYKNDEKIKLENDEIINDIIKAKFKEEENKMKLGNIEFQLSTIYPGLLLGSGYNHDTGLEGDFKLGFFFDYTTGMPVIPGSSVKGVLRSAFPLEKGKEDENKRNDKKEYINGILEKEYSLEELEKIELEIFKGEKNGEKLSMKERDIFFDAEIIEVNNKNKQIFEDDFLCPHGDNPLKNPIPLRFLKVAPKVKFEFRFELHDNKQLLNAEDKKKLFKQILMDLGIGAKTNVGYGQFE